MCGGGGSLLDDRGTVCGDFGCARRGKLAGELSVTVGTGASDGGGGNGSLVGSSVGGAMQIGAVAAREKQITGLGFVNTRP